MSFKVCINEGEWYQIRDWVLKHNAIETGGDLFGLWLDDQTAVVQFVLGPGKKSRRTTVSFFQDVDYLREAGTYLTKHHGLCNVGQWHSHHKINLFKPSVGDENTVWNNMPNLELDRYIVFIANITTDDVTINCFLFQIKNGQKLSVQQGKFKSLDGNSPLRLNEKVFQNVHSGAESFNKLTTFVKEMSGYIRNKDAKENLDINENESGTGGHTGSRGQDVVSARTKERKQKNSYSPNRTAGRSTSEDTNTGSYIGMSVQHRSQPIRHEGGFSQPIDPTRSYHNERQLNSTTTHSGQQQISALVRVKTVTVSNVKNTVKLVTDDQKRPINLPGAVSPNFDNEKQNQDKDYGSKGYPHQGNTNFGGDQISHETTKVKSIRQTGRQTCPKVEYLGGHPIITQQPSACRNSLYDNVEKPKQPATPMDTDEGGPITDTGQETRPETPSGIIISAANDNQDDEMGWLCKQFTRMSLCGSSKK